MSLQTNVTSAKFNKLGLISMSDVPPSSKVVVLEASTTSTSTSTASLVQVVEIPDDVWASYVIVGLGIRELLSLRCTSKKMKEMVESNIELTGQWDDLARIHNVFKKVNGLPLIMLYPIVKPKQNGYYSIAINIKDWFFGMGFHFKLNSRNELISVTAAYPAHGYVACMSS